MRIVCVLVTLRDSLFDSIQVFKQRRPEFTFLLMSGIEFDENEILVSSAYMFTSVWFKDKCRSFMYTKKRRGPKHEPWGTPHVMSCM